MQSRLSNDEFTDEILRAVNRNHPSAPITFEQLIDKFGGDEVLDHVATLIDGFSLFTDADDSVQLEVWDNREAQSPYDHTSQPSQDGPVGDSYLFSTRYGVDKRIQIYANTVEIRERAPANAEHPYDRVITVWAGRKTKWAPSEDGETQLAGTPTFDTPGEAVRYTFEHLDRNKEYSILDL